MQLSCLIGESDVRPLSPALYSLSVKAVTGHIDRVREGSLYVSPAVSRAGAYASAKTAVERGASAVVIEGRYLPSHTEGLPLLITEDRRLALSRLISRFHGDPASRMRMFGVTGTNGKTSTAYLLQAILTAASVPVGLIGTVECSARGKKYGVTAEDADSLATMTTPDPEILYPLLDRMYQDGIRAVVMEISSHALALRKVAPIFFEQALFTNLSPEHLDFHGTMERYAKVKAGLFSSCKTGVFNADDAFCGQMAQKAACRRVYCSCEGKGEYNARDIVCMGTDGFRFRLQTPTGALPVRLRCVGDFALKNTLLAMTAALEAGVDAATVACAVAAFSGVPGRLECIASSPFPVFIDYAHTEAALRGVLTSLSKLKGMRRLTVLFGCGGDRDRSKRAPMGSCAAALADRVILTSDNSRTEDPAAILTDVLAGIPPATALQVIPDRREAIAYALHHCNENDILLLAGKGHENYEITREGKHPFSERRIVLEILNDMKNGETRL